MKDWEQMSELLAYEIELSPYGLLVRRMSIVEYLVWTDRKEGNTRSLLVVNFARSGSRALP